MKISSLLKGLSIFAIAASSTGCSITKTGEREYKGDSINVCNGYTQGGINNGTIFISGRFIGQKFVYEKQDCADIGITNCTQISPTQSQCQITSCLDFNQPDEECTGIGQINFYTNNSLVVNDFNNQQDPAGCLQYNENNITVIPSVNFACPSSVEDDEREPEKTTRLSIR